MTTTAHTGVEAGRIVSTFPTLVNDNHDMIRAVRVMLKEPGLEQRPTSSGKRSMM